MGEAVAIASADEDLPDDHGAHGADAAHRRRNVVVVADAGTSSWT